MPDAGETASGDGANEGPVDLRAIVFAPITGAGLVQQTIRRLTLAINVGLLEEGDRLPAETELSGWLGISPMTLREALATLRNAGYIETKRGRGGGNFIRQPEPSISDSEVRGSVDLEYLYDLADFRRAIAAEAAALAAERATDAELEELARQAAEIKQRNNYLEHARLDARFRIGVAAASKSKRLWREQTALEMELNGVLLTHPKRLTPKQVKTLRRDHATLLAALKKHDVKRARSIVEAEVSEAADAMVAVLFGKSSTRSRKRS